MNTLSAHSTAPRQAHAKASQALRQAKRLVVKVGSSVLVQRSGRPQTRRMRALVRELAVLRHSGREVVLVTSGAIGAGMEALAMKRRPTNLPELQMAAAVGQSRLMTRYDKLFRSERCRIGQVLLTHDDLKQRARHLNARNTMLAMLSAGVIPIVNENDVVAVDEIKFGDNDLLAALVVHLIDAEALILLTTSDGLRAPARRGRSQRIKFLETITSAVLSLADGKGSELSTGGMASKLEAARMASKNGATVVIADGRQRGIIGKILAGADTGTLICSALAPQAAALPGRKRWIAFFHKPQGALIVDEGARRAIEHNGKSLLPIGIKQVEGEFEAGAAVDIKALDQTLIARGLVAYSSRDIRLIQGRPTQALSSILGKANYEEVIHRDNLALLDTKG
ncbi:MAG: glutamate 5-kinase [Lentisphaerae bacterium]|nr:glutamate 5-kinase [Lentisphaerota bacterium]